MGREYAFVAVCADIFAIISLCLQKFAMGKVVGAQSGHFQLCKEEANWEKLQMRELKVTECGQAAVGP